MWREGAEAEEHDRTDTYSISPHLIITGTNIWHTVDVWKTKAFHIPIIAIKRDNVTVSDNAIQYLTLHPNRLKDTLCFNKFLVCF